MRSPFELDLSAAKDATAFKACCAAAYESVVMRYLLGNSWHPGGTQLTEEIGERLGLTAGDRVLDVACGLGENARALASKFGCSVVGVDLSASILQTGTDLTADTGLSHLVTFQAGDAEALPFSDGSFDAVLCECALCTFPDKPAAVSEMARVLRPRGRLAIADVTLESGPLPQELDFVLGRILCVAEALPLAAYATLAEEADLDVVMQEDCRWAAHSFLRAIDQKLLVARIGLAVGKLNLNGVDIREARRLLALVQRLVEMGRLSYGYVIVLKR